jgi:hypothetical protein
MKNRMKVTKQFIEDTVIRKGSCKLPTIQKKCCTELGFFDENCFHKILV